MPAAAPVALAAVSEGEEPLDDSNVVISVKSSGGQPLSGVSLKGGRVGGYVNQWGTTGEDGTRKLKLTPGEYNITATYRNTSQRRLWTVDENGSQ